jgi:hypothetical protein
MEYLHIEKVMTGVLMAVLLMLLMVLFWQVEATPFFVMVKNWDGLVILSLAVDLSRLDHQMYLPEVKSGLRY